jgi:hypothetical protein
LRLVPYAVAKASQTEFARHTALRTRVPPASSGFSSSCMASLGGVTYGLTSMLCDESSGVPDAQRAVHSVTFCEGSMSCTVFTRCATMVEPKW